MTHDGGPETAEENSDPVSGRIAFLQWARTTAAPLASLTSRAEWHDLTPLGQMIGDAQVVALSEAVHGAREPLEFRNRVFEYLVREKGFTAIAIESGIVEGHCVHEYVRGGPGDLDSVVSQGLGWTFDQLPQNRELVRWLREYNRACVAHRQVNFYGFDIPGSPANSRAARGMDTALMEALAYLSRVDREASAAFTARIQPFTKRLRFSLTRAPGEPGYDLLEASERDAITAIISDLITLFETHEGGYAAVSSAADYEWAYRAALGARQADSWLRGIPIGWKPATASVRFPSEETAFLSVTTDIRDRIQADNLDWIVQREGPSGKVLVFAHRYHVSASAVRAPWWLPADARHPVMGTYLRRRLGTRLVTIGNVVGTGKAECAGRKQTLAAPPRESIDGAARDVGLPLFLLDLRSAPESAASWLSLERPMGEGEDVLHLPVASAFDCLLYIDTVSPALNS